MKSSVSRRGFLSIVLAAVLAIGCLCLSGCGSPENAVVGSYEAMRGQPLEGSSITLNKDGSGTLTMPEGEVIEFEWWFEEFFGGDKNVICLDHDCDSIGSLIYHKADKRLYLSQHTQRGSEVTTCRKV